MKTLEEFDFTFALKVSAKQIHELAAGAYLELADPVILIGDSGTGKRIWRQGWPWRRVKKRSFKMTCDDMTKIDWERYPRVAQNPFARSLLQLEAALGNAPNTLDAYARGREDFFTFCAGLEVAPESATKEHILLWVRDLTSRPSRHEQANKNHI